MGLIAIAANPASGRDIRRIVSYATVFDNREKQNIVERVILAASQLGEHHFLIMPDSFYFAQRIITHLQEDLECIPPGLISIPPLPVSDSLDDTTNFARYAEEAGAAALIVLGGDGTSRAAAKGLNQLPLIPISTGTNNIFPQVMEGTVVGMAAAALASGLKDDACCTRCKRIEIIQNGTLRDIALIDVVFSNCVYSGSKALWSRDDIQRVMVTQCHPASIGFSAVAGSQIIVGPEEEAGAVAECGDGTPNTKVSLAAGVITPLSVTSARRIALGEELVCQMKGSGMLALDGEREVRYAAGDELRLRLTRNGPLRVDVRHTLAAAQQKAFFRLPFPETSQ